MNDEQETIAMTPEQRAFTFLKRLCIDCRKCPIGGKTVVNTEAGSGNISNVFSNMNGTAQIMVVGQNPGMDEVYQGTPFVGDSGKVFDAALQDVLGIHRSSLYITNVVKCYTPKNRKPTQPELDACRSFLDREVEMVKPKVIIALGGFAFKQLTGMSGIMKHCGETVFSPRYGVNVLALLHPSPFNTNHPERRMMFFSGLEKLREYLDTEGV